MKIMIRSASFIFCLMVGFIIMSSCKKEKDTVQPGGDYFPLAVGNTWKIEHRDLREIVGKNTLEGKEYFLMLVGNDSAYFRKEGNSIYQKVEPTGESLLFKLDANVGDSWQFPMTLSGSTYNVTLGSKTDTITIGNQRITNCFTFYFDVPLMVDEEHSITLAPGIGYIQENCGFCDYPNLKLQHAKIDGVEISF
jgi:hypothetical protein